jgi:hypothetical protein
MVQRSELDLVEVDVLRIRNTCQIYQHWKTLYTELQTLSTRGYPFPGELSENFACYALGYMLNKGSGGDAYDPRTHRIIEMKGTGADTDDLSSFSPSEHFDELVFCQVDKNNDIINIYCTGINSKDLKNIRVNKTQTVGDQQKQGRRPRFSVLKNIIRPRGMLPDFIFDIMNKEVYDKNHKLIKRI